jgi:hypothetical protein
VRALTLDLIDAGHFTWEDAPDAYAELVTSWWAGGYAQAGPAERSSRRIQVEF